MKRLVAQINVNTIITSVVGALIIAGIKKIDESNTLLQNISTKQTIYNNKTDTIEVRVNSLEKHEAEQDIEIKAALKQPL